MENPLISVVLPVWKTNPSFLTLSIRSILEQDFTNLELLLVYKKSLDQIDSEIEQVFDENSDDHRLRIIYQKEKGFTNSLNLGIREANGNFFARMDSDDISNKNRFQEQLDHLKNTNSDLVGSWAYSISNDGKNLGTIELPTTHHEIRKKIMFHNPFLHPSILLRRSVIETVGNYNPLFDGAEDYDLYFRILAAGFRVSNLPKMLIKLRETNESITRGKKWKKNKLATLMVKKNAVKNLGFDSPLDLFYYSTTSLILLIPPKISYRLRNLWI